MVYKYNAENLLTKALETRNRIRAMIIDILIQMNAKSEDTAVEFDAENELAPSLYSVNCASESDGTDVYVSKIWVDKKELKANYYVPNAFDEEDMFEYGLSLEAEQFISYEEILKWLKDKID